ncbi:MAG: nucleotidyltransferase domain-containing protein [Clostridiales bacterium]|nr:nucleotidyltransferase domain-containing protein [Clostridiales bacterium]
MEYQTGIREEVIREIISLAEKYGLCRVILFGSRARGDYRDTSDIDLAVSGGNITEFSLAVEDETSTLLKFDIVNMDGAVQEELLSSVQKEGRVMYEKI